MKKKGIRDSQLARLIAEELDLALGAAGDSRLAELMVTGVEAKPGGRHFIVFVAHEERGSSHVPPSEMNQLLKRAAGYLRSELSTALNLKRTPELTIMLDPFAGTARP